MGLKKSARLLPVALLSVASGSVWASAFQLIEQNASGIGNAYAGSAAVAENASTIYFNPAGMTQLREREISLGLAAIRPSFKFSDKGSSTGVLRGDTDDAGSWGFLPNGYLSWALNKDVYVGLGLGGPFGLMTEYDKGWVGAAQSLKFDIKTYNINPSIAWRVNEVVSVGFGVNWQRMDAEYKRAASVASVPLGLTTVILDGDAETWGWNAGVLFNVSDATRLGVSYRSSIKHKLEGDLKIRGPAAGAVPALTTGNGHVDVEVPDTFIFSVAHQLDDRWELLGDVSWTGWSVLDKVDIVRGDGPLAGAVVETLDTNFRDTWRVALGANYRLNDAWKLRFGLAYDQAPVKDAEHRLTALPDNNRTWLSFGGQWNVTKTSALDVGVAYLYVRDTKIDNDQRALGRGRVVGDYDSCAWVLGAQYSVAF